jgi:membrane-associated progesterone receptor component
MPRTHAPSVLFTTYTARSLSKFSGHGHDGGRILLAIAGTVFDVTAGRGFYGPGERSLSLQRRKVTDEPLKMGCTGILRGGMRRGVWRNNRLMLARLALSRCAPSIADINCDWIEMLTPIDQPLDKLEDLTPEEMSALSFFSALSNADLPFSFK